MVGNPGISGLWALAHPMNGLSCFGLSSTVMEAISYAREQKKNAGLEAAAMDPHVAAAMLLQAPIRESWQKVREIPRLFLITILVMTILVQTSRMAAGGLDHSPFYYNVELLLIASPVAYYSLRDSVRRVKFFRKEQHDFLHSKTTAEQGKNIGTRKKLLQKSLALEVAMIVFKAVYMGGLLALPCLGIKQIISIRTVGKIALGIGFGYFIGSYLIRAAAIYHNENADRQLEEDKVWSIAGGIFAFLKVKLPFANKS